MNAMRMPLVSASPSSFSDHLALLNWLERMTEAQAVRVILRQRAEKGGDQRVAEWALPRETDPLAREIEQKAEDDARQQRGRSLYGVFAYRTGDKKAFDRLFLSPQPNTAKTVEGIMEQAPESMALQAGASPVTVLLSQLMRHNEASAHMALGHTDEIIAHYQRIVGALERRVQELEERESEALELLREMRTLDREEKQQEARAAKEGAREAFLREKLDMGISLLAAKFAGGRGGAVPGPLMDDLVSKLMGSFNGEQLEALTTSLRPEQAMLVAEIYAAYGKRAVDAAAPQQQQQPNERPNR
jgi:hypothetical protein